MYHLNGLQMDPYINRDVHFPVFREQNIQQRCWNLGDFLFSQIEVRRIDERLCWTHRKHNGGESHIMQIPSAARIIVPEDSVFAMALCKAYAKRFQLRVLSRTDRSKSSFVHFQRYCRRRSFGQSNIILATPTLYIDELNHISGVLCSRNDVRFWLALAILMSRYMFVRRDHRALCAKCEIWVRSS